MELKPRAYELIRRLMQKGVNIPNPQSIDIGEEVDIDQISAQGVTIYPGCRIYGNKTVISAGVRLGYEGPVTIENCQLGAKVELKGGFFSNAVFLEKANMGLGAQVREGSILEEEANGAHCVALKQTILFPFVTLGSLINFCDCLMAGGTSRKNHSEVGSSYIHFNFTPDADKTTPSLIGDVPRGVMLNQPPIFLGGQGGIVGPVRLGFGIVAAAGSIIRKDYLTDNQLIFAPVQAGSVRHYQRFAYRGFARVVENNIRYLANLKALETWYVEIRRPFFATMEFGPLLYAAVIEQLALAGKERLKRLAAMAEKAVDPAFTKNEPLPQKKAFCENLPALENLLRDDRQTDRLERSKEKFLRDFQKAGGSAQANYIETIKNLPPQTAASGVAWLMNLVDDFCGRAAEAVPALNLFKK